MLSSPSLTILVPLWFTIISVVFFYLTRLLFPIIILRCVFYAAKITHSTVTQSYLNVSFTEEKGKLVLLRGFLGFNKTLVVSSPLRGSFY